MARRENLGRELPALGALRTFETAARHGSFKDAAGELNVTPGAVSRQIKSLEHEIGVPLFTRGHRTVALTVDGQRLHEVIAEGFAAITDCIRELRRGQGKLVVNLGSTASVAHFWLLPRIARFTGDRHILLNQIINENEAALLTAGVDIAIRYGDSQRPGYESVRLFGDTLYPVVSPEFAGAHPAPTDLAGFRDLALIEFAPTHASWSRWGNFFRAIDPAIAPGHNIRDVTSYVFAVETAKAGLGVVMGWDRLIRPLIERGDLVRYGEFTVTAPEHYHLLWRTARPLSSEAATLRDWLIQQAAD